MPSNFDETRHPADNGTRQEVGLGGLRHQGRDEPWQAARNPSSPLPSCRMNHTLDRLADEIGLAGADRERLRFEFAYACVMRVRHLLEEPEVEQCLLQLGAYLNGAGDREHLKDVAAKAARLANHHQGSKSIDGCGHAAVSATYAVARAVEGKALDAASYAAYALVYAQGGSAAVAHRESFETEFGWQVQLLVSLANQSASVAGGNAA
jgi:hypothetical protein